MFPLKCRQADIVETFIASVVEFIDPGDKLSLVPL